MRTETERIATLHRRAGQLRQKRARRSAATWGGVSSLLLLQLLVLSVHINALPRAAPDSFVGTSMLDESAGAYVLVGVLSFTLGVVLTAGIRWYLARRKSKEDSEKRHEDENP